MHACIMQSVSSAVKIRTLTAWMDVRITSIATGIVLTQSCIIWQNRITILRSWNETDRSEKFDLQRFFSIWSSYLNKLFCAHIRLCSRLYRDLAPARVNKHVYPGYFRAVNLCRLRMCAKLRFGSPIKVETLLRLETLLDPLLAAELNRSWSYARSDSHLHSHALFCWVNATVQHFIAYLKNKCIALTYVHPHRISRLRTCVLHCGKEFCIAQSNMRAWWSRMPVGKLTDGLTDWPL